MALVRDFEIPGTGVTVDDAYHVIVNVKTEKRLQDIPPPPDSSREDGLTAGDRGPEVYWKAGYIGWISILVYASQEARTDGKKAIGAFGATPTEVGVNGLYTDGTAFDIKFMIDPDSPDSILTQAYNHLKSTEYYSEAQEV
jgi:hypothetical protein